MLSNQPLCQVSIAALQRLNDIHMVDDRPADAIVFAYRADPDRAHMNEECLC